jgi:hypothetical protein
MNRKTPLSKAIGLLLGGAVLNTNANLTSSATLNFTLGSTTDPDCLPELGCRSDITDIYGSYFAMDTNANGIEPAEKTPIGSYNGISIGHDAQIASGSHSGPVNGSEVPNIDYPWTFFGATGMHLTTSPITVNGGSGDNLTLDMSGWGIIWSGYLVQLAQIDAATVSCATGSSCSDSSSYTLDASFHLPTSSGFTSVAYNLHLEGTVSNVPLPAAAWLLGAGLLGLLGISRRKKAST